MTWILTKIIQKDFWWLFTKLWQASVLLSASDCKSTGTNVFFRTFSDFKDFMVNVPWVVAKFYFQIIRDKYGELDYVDLIPDGGNTSVNSDNRYFLYSIRLSWSTNLYFSGIWLHLLLLVAQNLQLFVLIVVSIVEVNILSLINTDLNFMYAIGTFKNNILMCITIQDH